MLSSAGELYGNDLIFKWDLVTAYTAKYQDLI